MLAKAIELASEIAADASASQWDAYASYFDTGIPYGEIISAAFIIGLCALATWMARKLYKEL